MAIRKRTASQTGSDDYNPRRSKKSKVTASAFSRVTATDIPTLQEQKEAKQRVHDALSPEDANIYHKVYNNAAKGKNASQTTRDKAVQRLQDLLVKHPKALKLHNQFADIFNARTKQKIPLATFYELEEDEDVPVGVDKNKNEGHPVEVDEDKGVGAPVEDAEVWQVDKNKAADIPVETESEQDKHEDKIEEGGIEDEDGDEDYDAVMEEYAEGSTITVGGRTYLSAWRLQQTLPETGIAVETFVEIGGAQYEVNEGLPRCDSELVQGNDELLHAEDDEEEPEQMRMDVPYSYWRPIDGTARKRLPPSL
jgi:hypothetical protein